MTARSDIEPLLLPIAPLSPFTTVDETADLFLNPRYERLLSLPVVDDGRTLGVITRFHLNQIFLRRYGRELHGRHPITKFMTPPMQVGLGDTLEAAAAQITTHVTGPLREDFVIVRDGRYAGVGVVLDLLRALQAKVQASQAQLVQSEKMASLGQMVAGVAHEINTPLGYVRNNVELLGGAMGQAQAAVTTCERLLELFSAGQDEAAIGNALLQADAQLREAGALAEADALMKDTLFGVDQIRDLVLNLRNFSRLDQTRVAEVSLNECLDQTLVIANHVLKNRVEVVRKYGTLPRLRCSPSQLNQVFLNLLTNAAQAIEHSEGRIVIRTEHDGDWVRISIQDNGKGIAPENLKKIFDPFFTTKKVGEGTGLGLSISFQIVQAHGGTIQVGSKPGVGTRFQISLPVAAAVPKAAPAAAETHAAEAA